MLKTYGRRRSNLDNERQQSRPKKRRKISLDITDGTSLSIEFATNNVEEETSIPQPSLRRAKTETFDVPARVENLQSSARDTQSEPNIVVRTVSRTYSGPSRSYLASQPTFLDDDPGNDDDESYADRRARWGVDDTEDMPRLPPNMMNDLKSITELRSSGESRRFLDQVGYLFEGMDPNATIGLRKTSAAEIVAKLTEEEFVRKVKAADFYGKIWEALCNAGSDRIFDILQVLFASLLSKDPVSLSHLASKLRPSLCAVLGRASSIELFHLISVDASDAELRKAGLGRTEKALANSIRSILKKAELTDVSLPLLISRALADMPTTDVLFSPILQSLKSSFEILHTRLESYMSGLPLTIPPPLIPHIANCLRIIDSSLLYHKHVDMPGDVWSSPLMQLCHVCERRLDSDSDAAPCLEMVLRVLVSSSHEDPEWSNALLSDQFISFLIRSIVKSHASKEEERGDDDGDGGAFDRSCLALGLLTNLVQSVSSSRMEDQIRLCRLDTSCKLNRECLRACQCSSSTHESALSILAKHFHSHSPSNSSLTPQATIDNTSNSTTPSSDTFIRCHLAILLGLFMRHSLQNQSIILSTVRLNELKSSAREFIEVSTLIKGGEGDGDGAEVVKDVVKYLDRLDR